MGRPALPVEVQRRFWRGPANRSDGPIKQKPAGSWRAPGTRLHTGVTNVQTSYT